VLIYHPKTQTTTIFTGMINSVIDKVSKPSKPSKSKLEESELDQIEMKNYSESAAANNIPIQNNGEKVNLNEKQLISICETFKGPQEQTKLIHLTYLSKLSTEYGFTLCPYEFSSATNILSIERSEAFLGDNNDKPRIHQCFIDLGKHSFILLNPGNYIEEDFHPNPINFVIKGVQLACSFELEKAAVNLLQLFGQDVPFSKGLSLIKGKKGSVWPPTDDIYKAVSGIPYLGNYYLISKHRQQLLDLNEPLIALDILPKIIGSHYGSLRDEVLEKYA
jgi:hypothetical protein